MQKLTLLSVCFILLLSLPIAAEQNPLPIEDERKASERMVLKINDVEYVFRWCPPGNFMMGNEPGQVSVTLSQGFWMLETEVTQAM